VNCIAERCGLGISVYAQAMDCLKGVDLAFNNFCRDLKLGGKKVFINRSLVMRDEAGNVFTPDDVAQQLFVTVGDSDLAEDTMITEHNPSLRTEENSDAVQHQLDYLSFRCGLGTRHYLFSGVQGKAQLTATQYTGERQDLIQNTARHRLVAERFLLGIARAALWAASEILGVPLDYRTPLAVTFDDSYFIDSESERTRDRAEVAAGLMLPYEYRMKWRGESEETAKRKIEEIQKGDITV
jgi:A118 family predicted phage portal protein